ncbi:MAG: tetratricopeptide repeat protein [Candidatus Omnitrophica bacterium]|nr:tetratricopeptide repeat protein [Candidatus Omnitrophota bacterium]
MLRIFIFILLSNLFIRSGFCFDWKILHENADVLSVNQAENTVRMHLASLEDKYTLALVYLNLRRDSEAEEIFDYILQVNPEAYEAKWGKAEVLRRKHNYPESGKILSEIIEDAPDFSPAYISLAYIKYMKFDFNQAVALATKVIEQGKDIVDLSNYVRAILIVSGAKGMIAHYGGPLSKIINGTAVFPGLKKAEKAKPDDPAVLFGLGAFYLLAPRFAGGDLDKSLDYLNKAVKKDPKSPDAYVRLGQAYKAKGDIEKYNFYLNKALEIDAANELALDIKNGTCRFICVGKK